MRCIDGALIANPLLFPPQLTAWQYRPAAELKDEGVAFESHERCRWPRADCRIVFGRRDLVPYGQLYNVIIW